MTDNTRLVRELVVENSAGIHARVSTMLVQKSKEFLSEIIFRKGSVVAHSDSMIDLLSLGAAQGEKVTVEVTGSDANAAIEAIVNLFVNKFYEE
jgi:phosphotransferase system HPr (HPr) family protein